MSFDVLLYNSLGLHVRPSRRGLELVVNPRIVNIPVEASLLLKWSELAFVTVAPLLASAIISWRHEIARSAIVAVWAPLFIWPVAIGMSGTAVVIGILLAIWKRRQPLTYGLCEIIFGALATLQVALSLWPYGEVAKFVALGSAVYVISRGAGNVADSFRREALLERLRLDVAGRDVLQAIVAAQRS